MCDLTDLLLIRGEAYRSTRFKPLFSLRGLGMALFTDFTLGDISTTPLRGETVVYLLY